MRNLLRIALFLTIASFFSPGAAALGSEYECFSRKVAKPSLELYREWVEQFFPTDSVLIRAAKSITVWRGATDGSSIWEKLTALHHSKYQPRDRFCIIFSDFDPTQFNRIARTDDGNLFLLYATSGRPFAFPNVTGAQHWSDFFIELKNVVQTSARVLALNYCNSHFVADDEEDDCLVQQAERFDNKFLSSSEREFSELNIVSRGTVHHFAPQSNSEWITTRDLSHFLDFATSIQMYETMLEVTYIIEEKRNSNAVLGHFPYAQSVRQWISIVVEETARNAVYRIASGILQDEFSQGTGSYSVQLGTDPYSIYPSFVPSGQHILWEDMVSQFICSFDFSLFLSLDSQERYWFNIWNFANILCSTARVGESEDYRIGVFDARRFVSTDVEQLGEIVKIGQQENIADRIEEQLMDLNRVALDHSQLLTDLKQLGTEEGFSRKTAKLNRSLARAKELARKKSLFEQAGTLVTIAQHVDEFSTGYEALTKILDKMPGGTVEKRLDYMWDKRESIGDTVEQMRGPLNGIVVGIDEVESWFKRHRAKQHVREIEEEISRVRMGFQETIGEMNEKRVQYRTEVEQIAREIDQLRREKIRTENARAAVFAEVVALNLYSNLWTVGGKKKLSQCGMTITSLAAGAGIVEAQEFYVGCLLIQKRVENRRACLEEVRDEKPKLIVAKSTKMAIALVEDGYITCFYGGQ